MNKDEREAWEKKEREARDKNPLRLIKTCYLNFKHDVNSEKKRKIKSVGGGE